MGSKFFCKGHQNYNEGKKIKVTDFQEPWNKYVRGEISQVKAAKMLGVSTPTFRKWAYEIIIHGRVDDTLSFLIWEFDD